LGAAGELVKLVESRRGSRAEKVDHFDGTPVVIASKAKRSRLGVRRDRFVWIASLSLAMTAMVRTRPYRAADGASIARHFDQRDVGTCERNGYLGRSSAGSAVDFMEASCFRSFASVIGARFARRLQRPKAIDSRKTSAGHTGRDSAGWTTRGNLRVSYVQTSSSYSTN
jgi:hypothetical protein